MRKPTIDEALDLSEREAAMDTAVDRLALRLTHDDTIDPTR